MRIQKDAPEYYLNLIKDVLKLRDYISYLHPVNQKALIRTFNSYFSTGLVDEDAYYKLKALHDILLNYKNL